MNNDWETKTIFPTTHAVTLTFTLKDLALIYDELDSIAGKASVEERMRLMRYIKDALGNEFISKVLLEKDLEKIG